MRPEKFHVEDLVDAMRRSKITTMPEMKKALGTNVDFTVFRKLRQLAYLTSYSHRGSYFALDELVQFGQNGLWSFQAVWFSRYGSLVDTAKVFVEASPAGYFVEELNSVLHVGTTEALLRLVQCERLVREVVDGKYLYCSKNTELRERQLLNRHALRTELNLASSVAKTEVASDELRAALFAFYSTLNEKQRRLYAGLESLKLGHGGNRRIAEFMGIGPKAVSRGRRELLERDLEIDRVRKVGGGRRPLRSSLT